MALVVWERWVSVLRPTTCGDCAALHGRLFREGEGPRPPLHGHCQCVRVFAYTEVVEDPAPVPAPVLPLPVLPVLPPIVIDPRDPRDPPEWEE